jgi:oligopeptide/dipeptide ABC transporter ATP-binding protein
MSNTVLDVRDLRVSLTTRDGSLPIVAGVDFAIEEGEIVGIVGESGSGKSLSAMSVVGLQPSAIKTTGVAQFAATNLIGARPATLRSVRGREIGIVFQDSLASLHPMLTVERQLTEPLYRHMRLSRARAHARALELLTHVRIPDPVQALKRYPHEFSGGMRQRIAIAMALACSPRLLIADEPTTALDVTVQAGILRLIDELRRETGLAVLLITHDLGVLSAIADRLYVFYGGRVVESGSTHDVIGQPRHPYTKALLDAVPHAASVGATLKGIPGAPPRPGQWPQGCVFQPRCAFAQDVCRAQDPPLETVGDDRKLRCVVDPFVPVHR